MSDMKDLSLIRQIHLDECDSTQDVLKEQLLAASAGEHILVSCENQTAGRGRGENKWTAMAGTLCFSLNISPHPVLSFTAIELSVIIAEHFLENGHKISLKWPNDLWNSEGKKCGGILVQGSHSSLLAGIGLNLWSDNQDLGGIFGNQFPLDKKCLAQELAESIHSKRISGTEDLKLRWLKLCGHQGKTVKVFEGETMTEGTFQGIGDYGEALIETDTGPARVYNGSLRLT